MGQAQETDSVLRETLRSLCCTYGWSFGVYWRFDHRNPMLLTLEDAYCEEQMRAVVDRMLLDVHILGEGVIGKAVSSVTHRWISTGDHNTDRNSSSYSIMKNLDEYLDEAGFHHKFSSGIKTVAVIPVDSQDVLQFGSNKELVESFEFLQQVRRLFGHAGHDDPSLKFTKSPPSTPELPSRCFDPLLDCCHSSKPSSNSQRPPLQSFATSFSTWTMKEPSAASFHDSSNGDPAIFCWGMEAPSFQGDSVITSVQGMPTSAGQADWQDFEKLIDGHSFSPSISATEGGFQQAAASLCTFQEDALPVDCAPAAPKEASHFDNVLQWLDLPLDQTANEQAAAPNNDGLGLEQLLENLSSSSGSANQLSMTKRRRTESSLLNSNQVNLTDPGSQNLAVPKSQVGLWIDDSYCINVGSTVTSETKLQENLKKASRKRARAGESTRPRPKDRKMIQDRLKELKQIIPNSGKLSIDALLDRTIKHLLFLQSMTKYAARLELDDEPKLIGQGDGVVLRDNFVGNGGNVEGATWAFEVGGQAPVCPIIVEDLDPQGQMLIEMLCEEGGFFPEIVDIIRGFSLEILKGVMELRDNKLWARFTVEADKNITRMDIFMSLVNLIYPSVAS